MHDTQIYRLPIYTLAKRKHTIRKKQSRKEKRKMMQSNCMGNYIGARRATTIGVAITIFFFVIEGGPCSL